MVVYNMNPSMQRRADLMSSRPAWRSRLAWAILEVLSQKTTKPKQNTPSVPTTVIEHEFVFFYEYYIDT